MTENIFEKARKMGKSVITKVVNGELVRHIEDNEPIDLDMGPWPTNVPESEMVYDHGLGKSFPDKKTRKKYMKKKNLHFDDSMLKF